MNKIYKFLTLLCLVVSSCFLISCEKENESDDNTSDTRHEKYIIVTGKSDDVVEGQEGDIYQYYGDGWRVTATKDTKIYIQRESCSGMNNGNVHEIKIGYTIFFKYNPEEVEYRGSPNVVRPSLIEAYRPECLRASNNIQYVYSVETNIITNTTTTTITTTNIIRR